jgi:hypothetical protein
VEAQKAAFQGVQAGLGEGSVRRTHYIQTRTIHGQVAGNTVGRGIQRDHWVGNPKHFAVNLFLTQAA